MREFKNLIILGPLIYAIHHFEEHIIYNFREWRLKYFSDNNEISTEAILIILSSILLIFIFIHLIKKNRASAHIVLFFLMTTQIINAFFHIFFSFYFSDFSPGTITSVLFYLPINALIILAAINEKFIKSYWEVFIIFCLGALNFALFEMIGPFVICISVCLTPIYYFFIDRLERNQIS
tara:strand:+ start:166 stop:702 length:537 start_codon:yes stop_codon:yes gene_type:complete